MTSTSKKLFGLKSKTTAFKHHHQESQLLQILPTPAFPFSHSSFTIWISQTVYFTSEHIRLLLFSFSVFTLF